MIRLAPASSTASRLSAMAATEDRGSAVKLEQRCSQHAEFQTKVFHPSSTRRSNDKHIYDLIGNMCSTLEQLNGTLLQCTRPNEMRIQACLSRVDPSATLLPQRKTRSLRLRLPIHYTLLVRGKRSKGRWRKHLHAWTIFQSRCGHDHSVPEVVQELQRLTTPSRACVSNPTLFQNFM